MMSLSTQSTPPASPRRSSITSPSASPRRTSSVRKSQLPRIPPPPPMENVFSWAAESRTRFVELVALQSLVSRVPSDPATQATKLKEWEHDTDKLPGWRLLPAKAEREAADNFAFLASADVGAEFTSAACVEERIGGGLTFRLAMNEGVMNEGVPQRIVNGLEKLCKGLETAAANGRNERHLRDAAWQSVLDLETPKIVKDLRSKFKRQLHSMFHEALAQKKRLSIVGGSELSLQSIITTETVQTTASLMDAGSVLEKIYDQYQDVANQEGSGRDEVERLLDTCYLARKSKGFRALVTTIDVQKPLVQAIEKLGRYKVATYSLVSLATKYPEAFKTIEVLTVAPPVREAFALPEHPDTGLATLASELTDSPIENAKYHLKKRTELSETGLLRKYEELYLGRPHIHAEIQLVKFYEENPSVNPPKFIGSSGKTCHLCSAFLELHGRFAVSKSCPTLYPRWTVPAIVCSSAAEVDHFQNVVKQMTSILESMCTAALLRKEGAVRRAAVANATPAAAPLPTNTQQVLTAHSLCDLNTSLRPRISTINISPAGGKENEPASAIKKPATTPAPAELPTNPSPKQLLPPVIQTTVSEQSIDKVRDRNISAPQTPHMAENIPRPSSARSSRVSTPAPRVLRTPLSPPEEEAGGVSLVAESPPSLKLPPALGSIRNQTSQSSRLSNQRPRDHGLPTPGATPPMVANNPITPPPLLGQSFHHRSKDLGLLTPDATPPAPPPQTTPTPEVQASKHPSTPTPMPVYPDAAPRGSISTDTLTALSATSDKTTSTSVTTATAKGKYRPMPPPPPLNLTIERHASLSAAEPGYTIYLAGNYSSSLSLGDAVFSGRLSDLHRKGEMIQCRGFRLRTGLRKRRAAGSAAVAQQALKVHEVVKTDEMMVLDIIFPDAVVRMEVFWDEEARSVVSAAA